MTPEPERWSGGERRDGLRIVEGLDGLVIMPAAGLSLDRCPCCDKPFPNTDRGLHGARLVADMLFPLRRNVTDADR